MGTTPTNLHKNIPTNYHYVLWYPPERTILIKHNSFPKKIEQEKIKLKQQDFDNERNKLQVDFYKAYNDLILNRIQGSDSLHIEISQKLRLDYDKGKRDFLTELAFDNFKAISGVIP